MEKKASNNSSFFSSSFSSPLKKKKKQSKMRLLYISLFSVCVYTLIGVIYIDKCVCSTIQSSGELLLLLTNAINGKTNGIRGSTEFFPFDIPYAKFQLALDEAVSNNIHLLGEADDSKTEKKTDKENDDDEDDDDKCFENDKIYCPNIAIAAVYYGVRTPLHCQALCRIAGEQCNYFTFVKNKLLPNNFAGACFMKTYKHPVRNIADYSHGENFEEIISGKKICKKNGMYSNLKKKYNEEYNEEYEEEEEEEEYPPSAYKEATNVYTNNLKTRRLLQKNKNKNYTRRNEEKNKNNNYVNHKDDNNNTCMRNNYNNEFIHSINGCSGSPWLCQNLMLPAQKSAKYDDACYVKNGGIDSPCEGEDLSVAGYTCCSLCDNNEQHVNACLDSRCYEWDVLEKGGVLISREWQGVSSPSECHTKCLNKNYSSSSSSSSSSPSSSSSLNCTHWNFVEVEHLALSLRGSCELRHVTADGETDNELTLNTNNNNNNIIKYSVKQHTHTKGIIRISGTAKCPSLPSKLPGIAQTCFEYNTIYEGRNVAKREATSPIDCKLICQNYPLCDAFTYVHNEGENGMCYLKAVPTNINNNINYLPVTHNVDGHTSGKRCCDEEINNNECLPKPPSECMYTGVYYNSYDIISLTNENIQVAEDCQEICQLESACLHFTYNFNTKKCDLKSANLVKLTNSNTNNNNVDFNEYISGEKYCEVGESGSNINGGIANIRPRAAVHPCLLPNVDFWGYDISGPVHNILTAYSCQEECKKNEKCKFFSYVPEMYDCYLKNSDEGKLRGVGGHPGHVSGPKFCSNNNTEENNNNNNNNNSMQNNNNNNNNNMQNNNNNNNSNMQNNNNN